jgi:class 3 adenylate cyclase/tetratricopeptide (TPR) repeat protein
MRCSSCDFENTAGKKFCIRCGVALRCRCPKCGCENPPEASFCGDCGASLEKGSATDERRPSPGFAAQSQTPASLIQPEVADVSKIPDGERKTVTALFADIKGSMELIEDLDPEEARGLIDPALKLMMDAVHHYEGYVAQSTGDGIFALFGAPVAHEDHPQRALHAARRMQEDLKRYADKLHERGQSPLSVRVGVNSGEVVVRSIQTGDAHTEYTPIGHSISLAARLQTLAAPGSVVIGKSVQKFVEGYFQLKALGTCRIKGVSEPVEVFEVTGLGPLRTRLQRAAGRGLTKFVGREREMEALKHAAEQARSGHGQIVAAMAAPGVGKSRLFFEFKVISQSGWMLLETVSVSHGKASAYLPVIDLLQSYFDIDAGDDARKRREKVNGKVLTLDRSLEDGLPYLFGLLGIVEGEDPVAQMDAQISKRRTLDAIKRLLLRESLDQPLMVIFEDLHWIDEQTQAMLNLLADSIGTAKILLLVNYRPEYRHEWGHKTYYTQLRLDPLGKESADEMLSALLGDGKDLIPLKRLIIERTEGTPFFMEEMVQALFEDGVIQRNGTVKLAKSMSAVKVPVTVQAILASRIDRLSAEEKELLQTLAVLGREFRLGLVQRVARKPEDELERRLSRLQAGEFIYEQPAADDVEYTFKHALTQEVAYNSVLLERRRALHERAGDAIEVLYLARLDDHLAELAHHYGRSASLRKAVHYLGRAGNQALERSAFSEGRILLSRGLEVLKELPDDTQRAREEIDLQTALGFSLFAMGAPGGSEREAASVRAKELSERLGDKAKLVEALTFLSNVRANRAELQPARELAEQAVALAELVEDPGIVARAHTQLGQVFFYQGAFAASREHFEQAPELFGPGPYRNFFDAWYARWNAYYLVLVAAVSGYPDAALKRSREALSAARRLSDPDFIGVALHAHATLVWELGEARRALATAEELLALAAEHNMPLLMLLGSGWRGWALAAHGQVEEGITELQRARAASAEAAPFVLLMVLLLLAEVYLWGRRSDEGLDTVANGLALAQKTGAGSLEPELYQIKGDLLLLQGAPKAAEAERCFRQAIQITRDQRNRLWELRATTSLARLLASQGGRDEACAMLAEIYNWFTEGFDTADLKDARALLDELIV